SQPTDVLRNDAGEGASMRHAPLNALRHELLIGGPCLPIAIFAALLHGADRPHAAIHLVAASLIKDEFTRRFIRSCKHRAHHDGGGSARDRCGTLTRRLDNPISNDREPLLVGLGSTIRNRSDLRHTYPGNYTCGANTARSDPDLHRVRAGTDELLRGLSS